MRLIGGSFRLSATDLSNFLACRHLTRLDAAVAKGLLKKPFLRDVGFDQLAQRGKDHEARVLDGFRTKGWVVQEIPVDENDDARARATAESLEDGVDVVYQGALRDGERFGLPDFLIRADLLRGDGEPLAGRYARYEVVDAKLARSAKAWAVLPRADTGPAPCTTARSDGTDRLRIVPYLQHSKDWTMTRDAIMRLAARLGREFTYGELNAELQEHDHVEIDGRGYSGALEAVAVHLRRDEPPWTAMVISADTGEPGDGLWKANPDDRRYADAGMLPPAARAEWLVRQRAWCIAAARVDENKLDQDLRDAEVAARDHAQPALVDLMLQRPTDEP